MSRPPLRVELVPGDAGEPVACSCSDVPFVPGAPSEQLVLASWLRRQCATQEVCLHADGSVSFAARSGARTRVRHVP